MAVYEIKKGFGVFLSPTLICDADGNVLYRLVCPWFGWSRKILDGSKTRIGTVRNRPWRPLEIQHDKYGVAAYPLDYPNAWDRFNERTGYGIWLHGVDHKNPEPKSAARCRFALADHLICLT